MQTKRKKKQGKPDPEILADVVVRVVRAAAPRRSCYSGRRRAARWGRTATLTFWSSNEGNLTTGAC